MIKVNFTKISKNVLNELIENKSYFRITGKQNGQVVGISAPITGYEFNQSCELANVQFNTWYGVPMMFSTVGNYPERYFSGFTLCDLKLNYYDFHIL